MADDWREKHYAWRRRVARRMPETAARVFALRGKPYMGSGFHWSMEKALGSVMRLANDFDGHFDRGSAIVEEVVVEALFKDISKAERSLYEDSTSHTPPAPPPPHQPL